MAVRQDLIALFEELLAAYLQSEEQAIDLVSQNAGADRDQLRIEESAWRERFRRLLVDI